MIQIRISADSMEELSEAKQRLKGLFTIYRLRGSGEAKNGRYKVYLVAGLNNEGSPKEQRKP